MVFFTSALALVSLASTFVGGLPTTTGVTTTTNHLAKRSWDTVLTVQDGGHTPYVLKFNIGIVYQADSDYGGYLQVTPPNVGQVHTTGFGTSTSDGDSYQALTFVNPVSPTEYVYIDVRVYYSAGATTSNVIGWQMLGSWMHGHRLDFTSKVDTASFVVGGTSIVSHT
ncbi:uncharacterized protein L969DRAFT_479480 [Mixia osmundae IAM 14324]|uniref:uncharacterized protein n=1 Tax=Mixia osmundae (strain CBS 9802 / IAM 14324 / JCM 22182 / KY 12970) TaxID=764103 RepID=UPI0004A54C3D|nr:uncharacterized protein L969DRAFT_479480 [Mixia osmundae IAM 14324]KEI38712.1 hypothetical protein L969DRAFT_479480 [Mixia osmundae IAM 14324]